VKIKRHFENCMTVDKKLRLHTITSKIPFFCDSESLTKDKRDTYNKVKDPELSN